MEDRMHHTGTVMLRTSRLRLRAFAPGDAEAMFKTGLRPVWGLVRSDWENLPGT